MFRRGLIDRSVADRACRRLNGDACLHQFRQGGVAIVEYGLGARELAFLDGIAERQNRPAAPNQDLDPASKSRLFAPPCDGLHRLADRLGGADMRVVRAVVFEKTGEANWFVPWHQDRVRPYPAASVPPEYTRYGAVPSSSGQSGSGMVRAEPPASVLEAMLSLRVHLDDCDGDDGPLEVVMGSHLAGLLDRAGVARVVETGPIKLCLVARGDILAMRPLLVHRSQRALKPCRRRVLHLDYLPVDLEGAVGRASRVAVRH